MTYLYLKWGHLTCLHSFKWSGRFFFCTTAHLELLGHWTGAYSQSFSCSLLYPSLMIIGQPKKKKKKKREREREKEGGGGEESELMWVCNSLYTYLKGQLQTLLGYRVSFCIHSDSVSTAPPPGQQSVQNNKIHDSSVYLCTSDKAWYIISNSLHLYLSLSLPFKLNSQLGF